MKRRWISGLAAGVLLGIYSLHGASADEEGSPPTPRRHRTRQEVESSPRMSDSGSRRVARPRAGSGVFDGKLVAASLAGDEQPTLLEQTRFEELQGRTFLVGKEIRTKVNFPLNAERHIAWDSVRSFYLFGNLDEYDAAMRKALKDADDQMGQFSCISPAEGGVNTVHVPTIDLGEPRRHLGEWLTEAVTKLIEVGTPLKVVYTSEADSTLSCTIEIDAKQHALEPSAYDKPVGKTARSLRVKWIDRRGMELRPAVSVPLPTFDRAINAFPELGQSLTAAEQREIERVARQIVEMLETTW